MDKAETYTTPEPLPTELTVRPATGRRAGGRRWEVAALPLGTRDRKHPVIAWQGTKDECRRYAKWAAGGREGVFEA